MIGASSLCVLSLPRPQEVSLPQQLGAVPAFDPDSTYQQSVEHEQTDRFVDPLRPLAAPPAPSKPRDGRNALIDRALLMILGNRVEEVGFLRST